MDVKLVNKGTTGELILNGRLDSISAGTVEKIFEDVSQRFDTVILNFSQLEYVASAGLRIILRLNLAMEKKGGKLQIRDAGKMVMEVLEMTGMAAYLTFI